MYQTSAIDVAKAILVAWSEEHEEDINHLEEAIDEKEKELQKKHLERLTNNECTPEAGVLFSDIISGLERVADHATNIAFATSGLFPIYYIIVTISFLL